MKIKPLLLLATLFTSSLTLPVSAEDDMAILLKTDTLWKDYKETRESLAKIKKPMLGEDGFADKLQVWSKAYNRHADVAKKLVPPLLELAVQVPEDDYEMVRSELLLLHGDLTEGMTQASHDNRKHIATHVLPHLLKKNLAPERAGLFAELTEPDEWIRGADQRMERGQLSEPTGWIIQDVHAVALARAGKHETARQESDRLLKKLESILPRARPGAELNHGDRKRTYPSLHREFLLHRALIEALAGDRNSAAERLAAAKKIEETDPDLQQAQAPLLEELSALLDG